WFGDQPPAEYQKISKVVQESYDAALARLKDTKATGGCTAGELDAAARAVIEHAGYGKYFIHTTGHGIGLEAHEPPALYTSDETALKPGITITIEPGIYLSGKFGVR
ncbi:MAG: M24 family metallopeptidase, partial [Rhodobacterales bacterium]|nr:M24 family metallopeptidase [Rhodobacterales bacterium]